MKREAAREAAFNSCLGIRGRNLQLTGPIKSLLPELLRRTAIDQNQISCRHTSSIITTLHHTILFRLLQGTSHLNINWKMKSRVFRVIDAFGLDRFLYFLQKHVTGRATIRINQVNPNWTIHKDHLGSLNNLPDVIEFGAGQSLSQNIYLSQSVKSQTVVDLFQMLDMDQFNDAAEQISHISGVKYRAVKTLEEIRENYGITYIAPLDLSNSPFPADTFDACISTSTLEHIPRESIIAIFKELKRILKQGGLISAIIDYTDHYAHTDPSISHLEFLSFSEEEFKKHNHKVHYQNRLRHYDYEKIFEQLGFELIRHEPRGNAALPLQMASTFDRNSPFITATEGIFLLRVTK